MPRKRDEQRKPWGGGPRSRMLVHTFLCNPVHCSCIMLCFTTELKARQRLQTQLHFTTTFRNAAKLSTICPRVKNLIIKILKQQTTETHSSIAPQSVSETLAREHPARVRGAKHMRQLYSSQNLLLSTATFSPGAGTRSGQKASAPNAAAAGRTCLKRPAGRACWAGAGAEPGRAEGAGFRPA